MECWIKLYRKVLENPVVMKDANHLAVWTYCLLKAEWKETEAVANGVKTKLKPGSFLTTMTKISSDLSIPRMTVTRIIECLQNERMLVTSKCSKSSIISVLNWDLYQESGHKLGTSWAQVGRKTENLPNKEKNKRIKELKKSI